MSPMPMQAKIGDASLKFGPDWLRALSSDTGTGSGGDAGGGIGGGRNIGGGNNSAWNMGSAGGGGGGGVERNHSGASHPPFSAVLNSSSSSSQQYHHQQQTNSSPGQPKDRSPPGNGGGGGSNRLYKLPEFKYSREEMLALYDKNLPPPNYLPTFGTLFVEKMQPPMAFSQASEEEIVSVLIILYS